MKTKFEHFLNNLKTKDNKGLMETIEKGFQVIIETYADVREERVDAISQYKEMASMTAQSMGNNVLNFLQNSSSQYNNLYSVDEEPDLDMRATSQFLQASSPSHHVVDEIEDDLGLTAGDMMELNF